MTLERIETVEGETVAVVLALRDFHFAALAFFHLHVDGSHHGLTGIFVGTRMTMIEYIPLTIDLADRTVGIAVRYGRGNHVALLVFLTSTSVDDGAAVGPGA